jgi:hypothetical protein
MWSYRSTLPTRLHGVDRDNFGFQAFKMRQSSMIQISRLQAPHDRELHMLNIAVAHTLRRSRQVSDNVLSFIKVFLILNRINKETSSSSRSISQPVCLLRQQISFFTITIAFRCNPLSTFPLKRSEYVFESKSQEIY